MNRPSILIVLLGVGLLSASPWCHAMETGVTRDGRAFVSGGIGSEETRALQAERAHYSLWLTTAVKRSGAYLADVQVRIFDRQDMLVLEHTTSGPWLFVDLPPGRFRIEATFNDQQRHASTTIRAGAHRQVVLYFDAEGDVLPSRETR